MPNSTYACFIPADAKLMPARHRPDTILPVLYISWLKKNQPIYDAHELFCEMKEIVSPAVYIRYMEMIERHTGPAFKHGEAG